MNARGVQLLGEWSAKETAELDKILEPLPPAWLERNPNLRAIVRESVLRDAPPEAPGHSKYEPAMGAIVVYDKGVYDGQQIDPEQFRRSVYHELAHSLIRSEPRILAEWTASTQRDGYVDDYARTHPEEDFADTFSEFFINRAGTRSAVPGKAEFIRQLLDRAQEKVAMQHFIGGFADELIKQAKPGVGRMAKMLSSFGRGGSAVSHTPGKMGIGKALLLGGGAAAGAGALAERHGEKKGYGEGTSDLMEVAQRARMLGRKEGVMAYHDALQARLKGQAAE